MKHVKTFAAVAVLLAGFGGLAHAETEPPSVSVSGQLFVDVNGDGVYDPSSVPGDEPLSGVFVTLAGPDGSPVTDVDGGVIGMAESGVPNIMSGAGAGDSAEPGGFEFLNLPVLAAGESYVVSVEEPTGGVVDLITPADGVLTTSALDTAGASDDMLEFVYEFVGPATQATIGPTQEFPMSSESISTSLVEPGVPIDIEFTVYNVGAEPTDLVRVGIDFDPAEDRTVICDPAATSDGASGRQILLTFADPVEVGASISCRFTIRALDPGEEAFFNATYDAVGEPSGTPAVGDSMLGGSLMATGNPTTTTIAAPTTTVSPTTVVTQDPTTELPETGSNSTMSGWAIALIAAGMMMLAIARQREADIRG